MLTLALYVIGRFSCWDSCGLEAASASVAATQRRSAALADVHLRTNEQQSTYVRPVTQLQHLETVIITKYLEVPLYLKSLKYGGSLRRKLIRFEAVPSCTSEP